MKSNQITLINFNFQQHADFTLFLDGHRQARPNQAKPGQARPNQARLQPSKID